MKLLLSILLFVIAFPSLAEDELSAQLSRFVKNVDAFNHYFPQEKVYLHLDNTGYFRGETIWFKAYVLRDDRREPTDLSRVIYVELLSPSGDVVETCKLHIKDGQADGSIKLDDNLFVSGFYELRAYTRYMLNWGSEGIFSRVVPVFAKPRKEGDYSRPTIDQLGYKKRLPNDRESTETESSAVKDGKVRVAFYPEGGHLVEGLGCKVAFSATYSDGRAVHGRGFVHCGNDTVCAVRTDGEGRGCFSCKPKAGSDLVLSLADTTKGGGRWRNFAIPASEKEGCGLSVRHDESHIEAVVEATEAFANDTLGLLLTHGGMACAFEQFQPGKEKHDYSFPLRQLDSGINRLSVITTNGDIVADRLFFVYPSDEIDSIGVKISSSMKPYGKISLVADAQPKSTFSLSVRDAATEVNGAAGDCASWLFLTSDLKGYVRNPDYYLEADDAEHREATDLLMMVQGWRRYDLPTMFGKKKFAKSQPLEDGLYLLGKLKPASSKSPIDGVDLRVNLYNAYGQSLSGKTRTAKDGSYALALPDCEGEWTMLMKTSKDCEPIKSHICIDRNFSPAARSLSPSETEKIPVMDGRKTNMEYVEDTAQYVPMDKRVVILKNVTIKKKRIFDKATEVWESESHGAYTASLKYDIDSEVDRMIDSGVDVPELAKWLIRKNSFFAGDEINLYHDDSLEVAMQKKKQITTLMGIYGDKFEDSNAQFLENLKYDLNKAPRIPITYSGIHYKNRPVVWVVNNLLYKVTSVPSRFAMENIQTLGDMYQADFPTDMDEAKAVYISEDNTVWRKYINMPELENYSPVTVFVYTHHSFALKEKGLRRTSFDGYAEPKVFESPDYGVLPKEQDFRRTLYWNPNVTTDGNGKATLEFWNNSSCRQMVISAEGITKEGHAMRY